MKKPFYIVFIIFIIAVVLNEYSSHQNPNNRTSTEISIDKKLLDTIIQSRQIQGTRKRAQVIEPIDIEDPSYSRSSHNRHLVKVLPAFDAFNKKPSSSTRKSILKFKGKLIRLLNGSVHTSGETENIRNTFVIDNPKEQTYLVLVGSNLEQYMIVSPKTYVVMNSLKDVEKLIDIAVFEFSALNPNTLESRDLHEYYTLDLNNIVGYHAVIYNIGGANTYHLSNVDKEK